MGLWHWAHTALWRKASTERERLETFVGMRLEEWIGMKQILNLPQDIPNYDEPLSQEEMNRYEASAAFIKKAEENKANQPIKKAEGGTDWLSWADAFGFLEVSTGKSSSSSRRNSVSVTNIPNSFCGKCPVKKCSNDGMIKNVC